MTFTHILAGATLALLAVPASAAFTLNNSQGGDGYVIVNSPSSFTVYGGNDSTGNNITSYGTVATIAQLVSGLWSYRSDDVDGSAYDPAGYFINGGLFQLTVDLPNPALQGGSFSFSVNPGDTYGFYVRTTDGQLGRGQITADITPGGVPEPASWAMLIAGFGLVGAVARQRRTARVAA
ncbi:PEPxxWA-CTERM sorting domain-containing protein [Sandarakinorhabdus oryzae]|uniref:PEPxxWA-CTERM sorting domain-containing protein n=1 Tax=Sandarakinorhabdus oryzae TaxID=2675220 RepID=UPI001F1C87D6|nr:PEPxxWA-CTERM sorting domain-containing protein [Sandarakinorhabdus oryzae]